MPGFFDKAKEAAQKAAASADKAARLAQAQLDVRGLEKQQDEALLALGRAAMDLIETGAIAHPDLQPQTEAVVAAQQKLAAQLQKIADIQAEGKTPAPVAAEAPAAPVAAAPAPAGGFCPNCGAQVPPGTRFCGECGTQIHASAT
jgi:hypothetical protein